MSTNSPSLMPGYPAMTLVGPSTPTRAARMAKVWIELLCLVLLGYAIFGKGWAYVGIPPIFIGELMLLAGVVGVMLCGRWTGVLRQDPFYFLLAMAVWGTFRTVPFLGEHGIDAVRDAMLWGYGAFAVIVYGFLIAQPDRVRLILRWYRHFTTVFLISMPVVWIASTYFGEQVPLWPTADVSIFHAKAGDVMVHVAGILAFSVLIHPMRTWQLMIFGGLAATVGVASRAGLLAFLATFSLCAFFRPAARSLVSLVTVGCLGLFLLVVTGVQISTAKGRTLSADGIVDTVFSIADEREEGNLDGTKAWRLNWWTDIWNYTVNGPYRWGGKGFGINLADDDGYQGTDWEGKLRSPHNAHMTVLARGGVPALAIWTMLHLSWLLIMLRAYLRAARAGQRQWMNLYLFILAYWLAFMINASFDVYLEGPMGGIWFWSLVGLGLAAAQLRELHPELMTEPTDAQSKSAAGAVRGKRSQEHEVIHG